MIKKFEEFINESEFSKYNNVEIRKKFRYDSASSKLLNVEKGPYILALTHGYSEHDFDPKDRYRRPYDWKDIYDTKRKNKIKYNIDTITNKVASGGKSLLTKNDIENANINEFIGVEDDDVLIYPFADYDEIFEFVNTLDRKEDVDVFDFNIILTQKIDRQILYNCNGDKELAKNVIDDLIQLFETN